MSNLGETIRSIAIQSTEASKPSTRMFGTVSSLNPLKIQVNEKLVLDKNLLIISQTVKNYLDCDFIEVGDSVIMTRQPGGQKYILDDMIACDKDLRSTILLNHTHKYLDHNVLAKNTRTSNTGRLVD